jgi:hypothetical protein
MRLKSNDDSFSDKNPSAAGDMDGTKPITNRQSRMVMLRADRGDSIQIDDTIEYFITNASVPAELEVIQRTSTYHWTELLLKNTPDDQHSMYLLTAPGPDAFLYLWSSETDKDGYRIGWSKIAEVKASFCDGLPKYTICNTCGEPIKSLEHERLAVIDKCDSLSD